jgi:hypothetical protein
MFSSNREPTLHGQQLEQKMMGKPGEVEQRTNSHTRSSILSESAERNLIQRSDSNVRQQDLRK